MIVLGQNNPTRASSEAQGHSARFANDGSFATFWQAEAGDTNAWFRVDLERNVSVSNTKLTFPTPGTWRYKIEISDDGESNWRLLVDQTRAAGTDAERTDAVGGGSVSGRFVRVSVVESPAAQQPAISEIQIFGTQRTQ